MSAQWCFAERERDSMGLRIPRTCGEGKAPCFGQQRAAGMGGARVDMPQRSQ